MNAHTQVLQTRWAKGPSTWNAERRSFEAVIATEFGVQRRDAHGPYFEVLRVDGMQTRDATLPVLDSHNRGSLDALIGTATGLTIDGTEVRATIRLGAGQLAERVAKDLDAGHRFSVSCGYKIGAGGWSKKDGIRIFTVTHWTLLEISIVSVPADPTSGIRSHNMDTEVGDPSQQRERNDTTAGLDRTFDNAAIRQIGKLAGCDQAWIDDQIDRCVTPDEARQRHSRSCRSVRPFPPRCAA